MPHSLLAARIKLLPLTARNHLEKSTEPRSPLTRLSSHSSHGFGIDAFIDKTGGERKRSTSAFGSGTWRVDSQIDSTIRPTAVVLSSAHDGQDAVRRADTHRASVEASLAFYSGKLGLNVAMNSVPAFAMLRIGAGTIGLLSIVEARKQGVEDTAAIQKRAVHVEFSTDEFDGLYEDLKAKGVAFDQPPHDEPWERSITAFDPMATRWSSRRANVGRTKRRPERSS